MRQVPRGHESHHVRRRRTPAGSHAPIAAHRGGPRRRRAPRVRRHPPPQALLRDEERCRGGVQRPRAPSPRARRATAVHRGTRIASRRRRAMLDRQRTRGPDRGQR